MIPLIWYHFAFFRWTIHHFWCIVLVVHFVLMIFIYTKYWYSSLTTFIITLFGNSSQPSFPVNHLPLKSYKYLRIASRLISVFWQYRLWVHIFQFFRGVFRNFSVRNDSHKFKTFTHQFYGWIINGRTKNENPGIRINTEFRVITHTCARGFEGLL